MTNQAGYSRSHREKERAGIYFILYLNMGPGRSLSKLYKDVSMMGQKISEKTLKRYSAKYEWQRRILEETAREKEAAEKDVHNQVAKMNTEHATIARSVMAMVVGGLKKHQRLMSAMNGELNLEAKDIGQLLQVAQRVERLARGQATSRVDIWLDVTETVVKEFAVIFLSVYKIEDREKMKSEYIRLSDEMINRYFNETTKQQLRLEGGS